MKHKHDNSISYDNLSSIKEHEFIVFALDHYNTLGLIRSLGEAGINPIYIAVKNRYKIASYSKYIKELHRVETIEEGYKYILENYANTVNKPFLYTIDDKTQAYLDNHYNELWNHFIFFNGGRKGAVNYAMDKYVVLQLAEEAGLPTPKTVLVNNGEVPKDITYPIITKSRTPVNPNWKGDVFVCNNEEELREAFPKIKSPTVVIQEYIKKSNESCSVGYAINHGKDFVITTEMQYKYLLPDYYSPYMSIELFDIINFPVPYKNIKKFFELLNYEGLFDIEFIIDEKGNYYFMEVNLRHSAWGYTSTTQGMNIPIEWAKSMLANQVTLERRTIPNDTTAMVEPVDFLKRVIDKRATLFTWVKDWIKADCKFYWNWKDLRPSIHMVFHNRVFR